jgi:hypothetical protein
MAYSDYLSPGQFGKHSAKVTKPVSINGKYTEVIASRRSAPDTGYVGKHKRTKYSER